MSDILYVFLGIGILFLFLEGPELLFRIIFKRKKKNRNVDINPLGKNVNNPLTEYHPNEDIVEKIVEEIKQKQRT